MSLYLNLNYPVLVIPYLMIIKPGDEIFVCLDGKGDIKRFDGKRYFSGLLKIP